MIQQPLPFIFPLGEAGPRNILMLPGMFRETMDMIHESYDCIELHEALDQDMLPDHIRLLVTTELSRITMRLTSIMAWLLARKAVLAEEMTEEEIHQHYPYESEPYCLEHHSELMHLMPGYVSDLMDRSHELYLRMYRLNRLH